MVKNALLCLALVSTGVVVGSLELGVSYALAADDCITESNLVPPKGSRCTITSIVRPTESAGF